MQRAPKFTKRIEELGIIAPLIFSLSQNQEIFAQLASFHGFLYSFFFFFMSSLTISLRETPLEGLGGFALRGVGQHRCGASAGGILTGDLCALNHFPFGPLDGVQRPPCVFMAQFVVQFQGKIVTTWWTWTSVGLVSGGLTPGQLQGTEHLSWKFPVSPYGGLCPWVIVFYQNDTPNLLPGLRAVWGNAQLLPPRIGAGVGSPQAASVNFSVCNMALHCCERFLLPLCPELCH